MKPTRQKTPARPTAAQSRLQRLNSKEASSVSDEVAVFCRVRPLKVDADGNETEDRCVDVVDGKTIQLDPPESSRAYYNGKAAQFSFKSVFDEYSRQSDVFETVGLPLVKELLGGKNGLLFTYGVTGSGKTHTMQGSAEDGGVMTRAIDVIFNSIDDRLVSRKYIIVPDKLNDFQIQSVVDAATMQQKDIMRDLHTARYHTRSNNSNPNLTNRSIDETRIDEVDRNKVYAVFVSYCEIYNKYIYDLLDDTKDIVSGKYVFSTKSLREDTHGNMFVYGATEFEVRSAREALEVFYKGQKRRRVAETQLNHESSRSHSIFNIRVVKCSPADVDEVDASKQCLVSQLALVDLAGSERTSRTGNTGNRLREAGNINNSLMNLRNCIERLRENQKSNKSGNVPYRNDKMTHLFRNYFEGIGAVKMVICVNPRSADYDENLNVLQFAEMASEIEIERVDPVQRDFAGMTPSRKRVEEAFQEALAKTETNVDQARMNPNFDPIYSLGPDFPEMDPDLDNDEFLPALSRFLSQRLATKNTLFTSHEDQCNAFRDKLVDSERELICLRDESSKINENWKDDKQKIRALETKVVNAEAANNSLQRRVNAFCDTKNILEQELDNKEQQINDLQDRQTKRKPSLRTLRSQFFDENSQPQGSTSNGLRKRSYTNPEDPATGESNTGRAGVSSRIADMEARLNAVSKKMKQQKQTRI